MELSVIGNRHRLVKHGNGFILKSKTKMINGNQGYNLNYLLGQNAVLKDIGEVIEIDWKDSFQYHSSRLQARKVSLPDNLFNSWKDEVSHILENEIIREKMAFKIPTSESYLRLVEAKALTPKQIHDYIGWLETTLNNLNDLPKIETVTRKPDEEEKEPESTPELEELRAAYKKLSTKDPDRRWKEPRLQREITSLKQSVKIG